MQDATRTRLLTMAEADSGEDGDVKFGIQTLAMAQMERDMRDEDREDRQKKKNRSFWYYKFPGMLAAIVGALGYGGYEMASAPTERLEAVEDQVDLNKTGIENLGKYGASKELLDAARFERTEKLLEEISPGVSDAIGEKSEILKKAEERMREDELKKRADEIINNTGEPMPIGPPRVVPKP